MLDLGRQLIGKPEAFGDGQPDAPFDVLVLRHQRLERPHHVADVGFGGVMQQGLQLQLGRLHQVADQQAVLRHAVVVLDVAVETAGVRQGMGEVGRLDHFAGGHQQVEDLSAVGEDPAHATPPGWAAAISARA
ncbi:hypothetical protein D9M69_590820 [compost metagenome]